jgi:protein deglycase
LILDDLLPGFTSIHLFIQCTVHSVNYVGFPIRKSLHGIEIGADRGIDDLPSEADAVLIPGGMPGAANIAKSGAANELIRRLHAEGKLVAAICAAPAMVLYPLGLLDGKRMTCYPGFEKELSKAHFSEERVVTDGTIITSRGPGTAAEFAEAVIAYLLDDSAAREIRIRTLQPA